MKTRTILVLLPLIMVSCAPAIKTAPPPTNTIVSYIPITETQTVTITPPHTQIPTSSLTITPTLPIVSTFTPIPDCSLPSADAVLYEIHDDRIHWSGMHIAFHKQIKEQLEKKYPDFYHFQQTVYYQQTEKTVEYPNAWYIIEQTSGSKYYINPIVLLVTVGESLEWKPPANKDLYSISKETRLTLYQHYSDFKQNPEIRSKNPDIANAATYAIYAYFDSDREKVQLWCEEYVYITGQDPALSPFK